jgi:heme/copper-type cytochrome/quinol oxidase subunit 2
MRAPRANAPLGRAAHDAARGIAFALTFALSLVVFAAPAAHACSVCYGADPSSPWAASINSGIYILLGVTGFVLGWFAVVILTIRNRARRWQSRKDALHVVASAAGSAAGPGPNVSKA